MGVHTVKVVKSQKQLRFSQYSCSMFSVHVSYNGAHSSPEILRLMLLSHHYGFNRKKIFLIK